MTDHVPRIRRANIDDAPAISSCVMAAYAPYVIRVGKPPAPALEDYSQVVSRHDVFVLTVEEKIAGVLVLIKQERNLLLDNVAVHPDYQSRGFGRRLITFAEEKAKSARFDLITLYTNEQMTENIELYKKLGFVETERRVEQGYRRVYMQKAI
jgi:ribosomal protein S18 acetylase RimI-like enzyme